MRRIRDSSNFVVFDIETTGLDYDSKVTCIDFAVDGEHTVFLLVDDGFDDVDTTIKISDRFNGGFEPIYCESEDELLEKAREFVEGVGKNSIFVAYNGETWNGGFDLPFLRTRSVLLGKEFLLSDVSYLDVYSVIDKGRFNTSVGNGEEIVKDLVGVYNLLSDGETVDVVDDSAEVVDLFYDGRVDLVAVHCMEDVRRTAEILELCIDYSAVQDLKVKNL